MLAGSDTCQHSCIQQCRIWGTDMVVSFQRLRAWLGAFAIWSLSMALLWAFSPIAAQAGDVALPPSGVKTPYSPLAIPTRLEPLNQSLEQLLDQHYHVVAAHSAGGEEILLLSRLGRLGHGRKEEAESTLLCALTMPDPTTDQRVPTSRCWALNHPLPDSRAD